MDSQLAGHINPFRWDPGSAAGSWNPKFHVMRGGPFYERSPSGRLGLGELLQTLQNN
jgi:hypothetical protein